MPFLHRKPPTPPSADNELAADAKVAPPPYQDHSNSRSLPTPPQDDSTLSMTAQLINLNLNNLESPDGFPTVDQAIAHLELLNAFSLLKKDIKARDGLFELCDSDATPKVSVEEIQEKRWVVYVTQAVERFRVWWEMISLPFEGYKLKVGDTQTVGKAAFNANFLRLTRTAAISKQDELPPLDVLMVWHAYKLNPQCYLEDCLRFGNFGLFYTSFPWAAIHSSLDANAGTYNPGVRARQGFESLTGLSWDKIRPSHSLRCPIDHSSRIAPAVPIQPATSLQPGMSKSATPPSDYIEVFWTTVGQDLKRDRQYAEMTTGKGFADSGFWVKCPTCNLKIDHDQLRASKFMKEAGLVNGIARTYTDSPASYPMGGTILATDGVFRNAGGSADTKPPGEFADLVVGAMLRMPRSAGLWYTNMTAVRADIEATMASSKIMKSIIKSTTGQSTKHAPATSRVTIRKMMSRYWDNSSPFALDLVGAVIRQGTFITKMADLDWLNSPAVSATTARLITKYSRFMDLMKTYKTQLLVPTLDVDLAWHTHQLSSKAYYAFTVEHTTRFIDHDDKIAETTLSDAFAKTTYFYENQFKEPYSECLCWYCEAIRASHAMSSGVFRKKIVSSEAEKQLYAHARDVTDDPNKGCHISAHSAIRPPTDSKTASYMTSRASAKLDKDFEKAVKRALQDGRKPPKRDRDMGYGDHAGAAYGYGYGCYPFPMPMYGGYYGGAGGMYVSAPACGAGVGAAAGSQGNCAAGTCGGGVGMGSCAQGAGGSCGGGGMGGGSCGGGGGGGCGGGGGGGGCGGGGGGGGCGGGGGG